ncbi:MAG TPA: TadG family pilus assembly protein [Phycisphaerae bacterium]|nr:TadG family pilus assembly protein [Phycisphaerae bacterium]
MKIKKWAKRGSSLVLTAILGFSMVSLTGLGMDAGWVYISKHQLQNTADAAALAGAQALQEDVSYAQQQASSTALSDSVDNVPIQLVYDASGNSGDVVVGNWANNTFTPGTTNPNAVQVTARRYSDTPNGAVPLFFSGLLGASQINVSATAIAVLDTIGGGGGGGGTPPGGGSTPPGGSSTPPGGGGGSPPPVICVPPSGSCGSNPGCNGCTGGQCNQQGGCGISCNNGSCLNCNGGSCVSDCNVTCDSGSSITCSGSGSCINVAYGCSASCSGSPVNTGCSPCANPLAGWSCPTSSSCSNTCTQTSGTDLQPGYYPNGICLTSGSCTLEPGTYVCDSGSNGCAFSCSGTASCTGNGVTICCESGGFQCTSSGNVNLSPPTSGSCSGITVCQPSTNNSACSFSGCGSNCHISGECYFPNANVSVIDSHGGTLGSQVITDGLNLNNSNVTVGDGTGTQYVVYLVK